MKKCSYALLALKSFILSQAWGRHAAGLGPDMGGDEGLPFLLWFMLNKEFAYLH